MSGGIHPWLPLWESSEKILSGRDVLSANPVSCSKNPKWMSPSGRKDESHVASLGPGRSQRDWNVGWVLIMFDPGPSFGCRISGTSPHHLGFHFPYPSNQKADSFPCVSLARFAHGKGLTILSSQSWWPIEVSWMSKWDSSKQGSVMRCRLEGKRGGWGSSYTRLPTTHLILP